jgi:Flp pilus assembly protein TadG
MRARKWPGGLTTRKKNGRTASERGTSMVEFVMTLLIITFVLFLLVEFSLWVYAYNVMADAAKAGVRYAIVHGANSTQPSGPTCTGNCTTQASCSSSSPNVGNVQTEVKKWAKFSVYSTSGIDVTVCYLDGTNTAPGRVQVKISNPTTPFFSGLFRTTAPVTATAQGRIVN